MKPSTIVIVGGGGREHAIGWKLSQSHADINLHFLPGNGGTALIGENHPVSTTDLDGIVSTCNQLQPDLVLIGPEDPLVAGLADRLRSTGFRVFGPDSYCARLEGSKSFAKSFMSRYSIPTATHIVFTPDNRQALLDYLIRSSYPLVLKADGLAAGKGVVIAQSQQEALEAVSLFFDQRAFGASGDQLVIEEFMDGEEATVFVLTDGTSYSIMPAAQDHKRIGDGDTGKNTGGMGAYAPAPVITASLALEIEQTIIKPTLEGLRKDGHPYNGVLYVGLMITSDGPRVVEYNVRFGDPECQVQMMLIDGDLLPVFQSIADGRLTAPVHYKPGYASVIVAAAQGYPDQYEKGNIIRFQSPDTHNQVIFHAGTANVNGNLVTAGGRVLNSCAYGETLQESLRLAYEHLPTISFDGMVFRSDIGKRGLVRLSQQ